jgi:hypothetical protein
LDKGEDSQNPMNLSRLIRIERGGKEGGFYCVFCFILKQEISRDERKPQEKWESMYRAKTKKKRKKIPSAKPKPFSFFRSLST